MSKAPFGNLDVVLVRPQHSGNIGAVARSIANHGLGQLVMVDPPAFDPDRARWMAPHAHHIVNSARMAPDLLTAVQDCDFIIGTSARQRKWGWPTITLPQYCELVRSRNKVALLFGPEDSGLSNQDLALCHAVVALPTHEHQSLNLSQAVNVFGAHLQASIEAIPEPVPTAEPHITALIQQRMVDSALSVLESIGYFKSRNPLHFQSLLFRLCERANPTVEELATLRAASNKVFHTIRVLREQKSEPVPGPPAALQDPASEN